MNNMQRFLYNHPSAILKRRTLRSNQTNEEKLIWSRIRNKQLFGFRFFRQYGVGPYVLDFYCPQVRLAIEIDGGQHAETSNIIYDKERTEYLKELSIRVLRFWNNDVSKNIEAVLERIADELRK